MGRYKVLEAIGEGSFGKVFRGQCKETNQIVALKFIPKHLKGDTELISLRRECEIQRGLSHPNIVLMLDSFETERELVAVSEYVPRQLCALLKANGCMSEEVVQTIACNLVSALYYLHSHRIVHRDIKPQNILLTNEGIAKLCDFGFSKKMEINTYVLESIKGTPLYMAPELIEQQPYDHKADLWSLGCILYELLMGKPPFSTSSIVHLIEMVRSKPVQWPNGCSKLCISFLQGLLQKDQDKRFEWPDMLQHPWVSAGITVMPHNPRIASLTSPLTHSQQQVKEHQKQQLVRRNMGQPNLLPRAIAHKIMMQEGRALMEMEGHVMGPPAPAAPPPAAPPVVGAAGANTGGATDETASVQKASIPDPTNICSSLEKMSLSNGTVDHCKDGGVPNQRYVASGSQHDNSQGTLSDAKEKPDLPNVSEQIADAKTDSMQDNITNNSLNESSVQENCSEYDKRTKDALTNTETQTSVTYEAEIQEDEWCHFVNQSMADVMGGNLDVYTQPGEVAMFVAPLRNSSCPLTVAEKISTLFMLPFVNKPNEDVLLDICKSYLDHKVVCNLIFACKQVKKNCTSNNALEKEEIQALSSLLMLVCHLIHLDVESSSSTAFLTQLCEGVCVLECHTILGICLSCPSASPSLLANVLAILSQILRNCDISASGIDPAQLVLSVVSASGAYDAGADQDREDEGVHSLRLLLMSLLTHTGYLIRSRTCTLLAYLTVRRSGVVYTALAGQHKLLCDLINLENDPNSDVRKAASFALNKLQQHTTLLSQPL